MLFPRFELINGSRNRRAADLLGAIVANLTPQGYHELSRTQLIKPTSGGAGSRQLGKVNWTLPAYANRHIIIRNDEEIIRASLEK